MLLTVRKENKFGQIFLLIILIWFWNFSFYFTWSWWTSFLLGHKTLRKIGRSNWKVKTLSGIRASGGKRWLREGTACVCDHSLAWGPSRAPRSPHFKFPHAPHSFYLPTILYNFPTGPAPLRHTHAGSPVGPPSSCCPHQRLQDMALPVVMPTALAQNHPLKNSTYWIAFFQ